MEQLLELAKDTPWVALCGYLLWRMNTQENKVLTAFKDGAESHRQLAEALQTMQRLEEFHRQTAEKLTELRLEIKALQK